ncbi:hypothetical protein pv_416 [Pithovirus sibericum]|uniref:Uncharacterized protein n=1 Tax=Pithovirus sibericum TaxID=1450746 RepID=W5S6M2_9VIRU|nr:hypothetical protein pv_416 [Pithovirus sibericum]AHH01982.1 hypothetical protein pv_416 [Pithovirus sibericum]
MIFRLLETANEKMSNYELYFENEDEIEDFTFSHQLKSIRFVSYWKYRFTLEFETLDKLGGKLRGKIQVGGNPEDIYSYDPSSLEWSEHRAAEIQNIQLYSSN